MKSSQSVSFKKAQTVSAKYEWKCRKFRMKFESFLGLKAPQKGTGLHIMNKRSTVLRLIQIPGGTDGFKVNRGDFRRRHGHMSTSNAESGGGLKRGAMVCEDER